jgi:hypothetical protein
LFISGQNNGILRAISIFNCGCKGAERGIDHHQFSVMVMMISDRL